MRVIAQVGAHPTLRGMQPAAKASTFPRQRIAVSVEIEAEPVVCPTKSRFSFSVEHRVPGYGSRKHR